MIGSLTVSRTCGPSAASGASRHTRVGRKDRRCASTSNTATRFIQSQLPNPGFQLLVWTLWFAGPGISGVSHLPSTTRALKCFKIHCKPSKPPTQTSTTGYQTMASSNPDTTWSPGHRPMFLMLKGNQKENHDGGSPKTTGRIQNLGKQLGTFLGSWSF